MDSRICCSCGKELSEFEMEFYSFEGEYRRQECFMYLEFRVDVWWSWKDGKWLRERRKGATTVTPRDFWMLIDQARREILFKKGGQACPAS